MIDIPFSESPSHGVVIAFAPILIEDIDGIYGDGPHGTVCVTVRDPAQPLDSSVLYVKRGSIAPAMFREWLKWCDCCHIELHGVELNPAPLCSWCARQHVTRCNEYVLPCVPS